MLSYCMKNVTCINKNGGGGKVLEHHKGLVVVYICIGYLCVHVSCICNCGVYQFKRCPHVFWQAARSVTGNSERSTEGSVCVHTVGVGERD